MDYFKVAGGKARRFPAYIRKFEGKMIKTAKNRAKEAADARRPACVLTVDVPITNAMLGKMPKEVDTVIKAHEATNGGPSDAAIELKYKWGMTCVAKIFETDGKDEDPIVCKGGDNDDRVTLQVKKFFFNDDDRPMMQVKLTLWYDAKTWAWGGKSLTDPEVTLDIKPLQLELDFEDEGDGESENEEEQK